MQKQTKTTIQSVIPAELFERRCVHVIDLAETKAASGPLWSEIGDSVCGRLESIFRLRLDASGTFEKVGETRYVIVTPSAQSEDGLIIAFRIVSELQMTLNGRCEIDQMHIEIAVADGPNSIKSSRVRVEQLVALSKKHTFSESSRADPHRRTAHSKNFSADFLITHQFEPIWDARHQVVSTYLCTAAEISSSSAGGTVLQLADLAPSERTIVELSCLRTGVGKLSRCLETGDRFLLGIRISFETLCSPAGRMEFSGTCRGLPALYRPYIMFLLVDVPLGVTQSRLADLSTILRPFGHVVASVAPGCRNFSAYDCNRFSALVIDLAQEDGDLSRMRNDILQVGRAGQSSQLGPMILNITDPQTLTLANAADYQFMHGPAVTTPVQSPRRMSWLPTSTIMPAAAVGGGEDWF